MLIILQFRCRTGTSPSWSRSATCLLASAYTGFQAPQRQDINHHISKRGALDQPPRGGKVWYCFSAFWLSSRGFHFSDLHFVAIVSFEMASQESSVEISKFTSSGEPGTAPDASSTDDTSWADRALEANFDMVVAPTPNVPQIEVPVVLASLKKKGLSSGKFTSGD